MSIMKRFSIHTLIVTAVAAGVLLGTTATELSAQEYTPVPVTVSTNKLKVDGKLCYSHIVLERQTLYSICKAYNVTAEDLYKYNPGLKENGLKKNGILIIPAVSTEASAAQEQPKKDTVAIQAPAPKKAEPAPEHEEPAPEPELPVQEEIMAEPEPVAAEEPEETFIPVSEEEPFEHLDMLENAVLEVCDDEVGIILQE